MREVLTLFSADRHAAKLGAEYTRTIVDGVNGQGFQDVIVTIRPFFELYGRDSFQIPQGVGFLAPGDERTRLRNSGISLFAQDDWRVAKGVTLNLGVRYDYDSKFDDGDNVAPRLGITWNPDDKTVVRANWGLFSDRYRLGIAQSVPELGGFNGRTVVELDYPRLTADALVPFPGSLAAVAAAVGNPFFIHEALGIPPDAVVTRSSIQSLTGLTPEQFLTALEALVGGLGLPLVPVALPRPGSSGKTWRRDSKTRSASSGPSGRRTTAPSWSASSVPSSPTSPSGSPTCTAASGTSWASG